MEAPCIACPAPIFSIVWDMSAQVALLFLFPFTHTYLRIHLSLVCMLSHFYHVRLCAIPWTVAHQTPLSMRFSGQEYWSGLPRLPPGDFPNSGVKPVSLVSPALAGGFFTTSASGPRLSGMEGCN